jgi:hypothetical protein
MLGAKIAEHSGKVTSQRVLSLEGGNPKVETSIQASERILGVPATTIATYWAAPRPDGYLQGEVQGVVMGRDGEMATYTGGGVGRFTEGGGVIYRGAIYYQTSSQKWASLNGVAAVFEYEADGEGNTRGGAWEWK